MFAVFAVLAGMISLARNLIRKEMREMNLHQSRPEIYVKLTPERTVVAGIQHVTKEHIVKMGRRMFHTGWP